MRKLFGSALLLSGSFFFLTGFGATKHSEVQAQSSVKGKTAELEFKVTFDTNAIDISKDAPWSLELLNTKGLKLETKDGKFITRTLDEKLPGFKVNAELDGTASAGKVDFVLDAFICTTKKEKVCYKDKHKGTLEWKKS
jgi:hypothetical protein